MENIKLFHEEDVVHLLDSEPDKAWVKDHGFDFCFWDGDIIEQYAGQEGEVVEVLNDAAEIRNHGGRYNVQFFDGRLIMVFGYDIAEFYGDLEIQTIEETDLLGLLGGV